MAKAKARTKAKTAAKPTTKPLAKPAKPMASKRTTAATKPPKLAGLTSKTTETALGTAAQAIATADYAAAIDAANALVSQSAKAAAGKDMMIKFRVDVARCLLAYAQRCAGNASAAPMGITESFNKDRSGDDIREELAKLVRKAELSKTNRRVLSYCLYHLVFWRETLAANLHTKADVAPATIDPMIETVRAALAERVQR